MITEAETDKLMAFFVDFPQAAELVLGYPARMMSPAEWREAYWRIWPGAIDHEDVQAVYFISEWFAHAVPFVEERVGKTVADMSEAERREVFDEFLRDLQAAQRAKQR